jgi:putative hemolysin
MTLCDKVEGMTTKESGFMDISSIIGVLAVLVLIATNGFFVAAEFALVKIRATRIEHLVNEGHRTAKVVQKQIGHLDTYIAATQLGITLASLALGWIGEPSLAHLVEPLFAWIGGAAARDVTNGVAIALSFAIITAGHIVLGELVPKAIALQQDEKTALFVARPLWLFARLFRPIILLMNSIGNAVVRMLGLRMDGEHTSVHSPEELEMLILQSRKAGLLEQQETEFLRHVFTFEDKLARQIMTPRTEMVGLPVESSFADVRKLILAERYTRYPVYEKSIDFIVGTVHLKDLVAAFSSQADEQSFTLRTLLRPVLAIPETTSIGPLLTRMQREGKHLAVIIDEYGETAGIVTLEDILEELVGEVQDEFDLIREGSHPSIETLPDGSSSVDGLLSLADFTEHFGVKVTSEEVETLGGYIQEQGDRIPRVGDTLALGPYLLRVSEMDGRRVARVRVLPRKAGERGQPVNDLGQFG